MELIIGIVAVVAIIYIFAQMKRRVGKQDLYAKKTSVVQGGFDASDELVSEKSIVLFSETQKRICIITEKENDFLDYSIIRKWSYEMEALGVTSIWSFRVMTADPKHPLFTIWIYSKNRDMPELWMAKFAAHLNG